jgi:amino acid adenylation domain-containing protein
LLQSAEKTWKNYLKIMSRQPKKRQRKRSHERAPRGAVGAAQSLAARFEQQVLQHGERIAVKSKNQLLTYDQLNRAANRLARAILSASPSCSEPVALLFKQGAALITANLAALKTGRPFVQIDDKLPQQRAARLIADAEARVIITDGEHFGSARRLAGGDKVVLNLDALQDDLADTNLGLSIAPTAIAYINYTSGSTGEPKGVMSDHVSELHSIGVKAKALCISPEDRISLLRSNNVGATSDALLGLLNGAALCPLELKEEGLAGLGDWLIQEEITVFTCVASVFRHALRNLGVHHKFSRIRLVHVGGEPLFQSDVELFKEHFADNCRLVNRLGISETKTASYFFIDKNSAVEEPVVPVGFALDGYEITVLDEQGRAVGANCVGEIAVKSRYLAIGYWRRPELTQAKFLPDPFDSGARVYLSGDLGYLRPDGCLVHVGRKDFQIKIRGHRVELAEVEIALLDIAGIKQAAVAAREHADGSARLLAYVVLQDEARWTVRQLRAALQEKLPSYMIPAAFVILERLPMTTSGKIDRGALPAPQRGRSRLNTPLTAPQSALEKVLAQLWCEILDLDELGSDDEFGELGGDSLFAAQAVARVNDWFSLDPPLKTLFEMPTVAALAAYLISRENTPGQAQRIAETILQVADLSPGEIAAALAHDGRQRNDG